MKETYKRGVMEFGAVLVAMMLVFFMGYKIGESEVERKPEDSVSKLEKFIANDDSGLVRVEERRQYKLLATVMREGMAEEICQVYNGSEQAYAAAVEFFGKDRILRCQIEEVATKSLVLSQVVMCD